ncbi:hypothetical protein B296_00039097 [Ensete ventricosum]|uniref:Secreted protein n=1 Tax=Ensete ventricosum TaxID=4639 RepID=A0A426ZUI2_ENSVE|nr:hypothetical protein B296_00039097 [Ensete ventricosum]
MSLPSSLLSLLFTVVAAAARRCRCRSSRSPGYQYTDRPLPGGTAKIDSRWSIEREKGKKKNKRKRRKKKKNAEEEKILRAVLARVSSPPTGRP